MAYMESQRRTFRKRERVSEITVCAVASTVRAFVVCASSWTPRWNYHYYTSSSPPHRCCALMNDRKLSYFLRELRTGFKGGKQQTNTYHNSITPRSNNTPHEEHNVPRYRGTVIIKLKGKQADASDFEPNSSIFSNGHQDGFPKFFQLYNGYACLSRVIVYVYLGFRFQDLLFRVYDQMCNSHSHPSLARFQS